jgi:hypothetical protein
LSESELILHIGGAAAACFLAGRVVVERPLSEHRNTLIEMLVGDAVGRIGQCALFEALRLGIGLQADDSGDLVADAHLCAVRQKHPGTERAAVVGQHAHYAHAVRAVAGNRIARKHCGHLRALVRMHVREADADADVVIDGRERFDRRRSVGHSCSGSFE